MDPDPYGFGLNISHRSTDFATPDFYGVELSGASFPLGILEPRSLLLSAGENSSTSPRQALPETPHICTVDHWTGNCNEEVTLAESCAVGNMRSPAATPTLRQGPSLPSVTTFPADWTKIPQETYDQGCKQLGFIPSETIRFSTKYFPGINLKDALRRDFSGLNGHDDSIPGDLPGVILCRLLFPGYSNHNGPYKIHTLNWKKTRKPIPRSKLAHEVAKRVYQHLTRLTTYIPDPAIEDRWRVGQGSMFIDNMYLVSLVSVSRGSFQPEIWIAAPQVTHAHASGGSS